MNRACCDWMRVRRGFTIIEMLMVVAIISVLIGIAFTAVTRSLEAGRRQKANALCTLVEQGISTYYAAYGDWPITLDSQKDSSSTSAGTVYTLTAKEVRDIIREVIQKQAQTKQPLMDVAGLYVSKYSGEPDSSDEGGKKHYGMDFMSAVCGTERNPSGIRLSEMFFGYPDPSTGYFRRFNITYSPASDSISVSTFDSKSNAYDRRYDELNKDDDE